MLGSVNSMGKALIDPSGKVHIGRNIDGFDAIDMARQLKEAKLAGVKKQEEAIDRNKTVVIPAMNALQAQIQALHDDAAALRNYLGTSPTAPNVFNSLQSSVVKSGEVTTSYIDVTIDSAVATATKNAVAVQVHQLAKVDSRITNSTATILHADASTPIASADDPLGISGSFTFNGGATITVNVTDTLNTIVGAINSSNSNVKATYTQNGTNYYLTLTGTNLATPLTFVDGGNLLSTHFGINTTTPTDVTLLQAQVRCVTIDGANGPVTKTYSFNTNRITGLIPGVTLNLLNTTLNSGGTYDTLNVSVNENTSGVQDKIIKFFNDYNNIQETLNRNTLVDDEGNPPRSKRNDGRVTINQKP